MQLKPRILLLTTIVSAIVAETPQNTTESFVWRYGNQIIGRLSIPKGCAVEVYDYREGIVTTLRYQDGAYIVLQVGGMYRVPMFQDPEHTLISSPERDTKRTRIGRFADRELYWREDNYKHKKYTGKRLPWLAAWPPNLGYAQVPSSRQVEFDKALESFIREVDKTRPPHRVR